MRYKKLNIFFLLGLGLSGLQAQNNQVTVADIDGNVYQTTTIGSQVWMKENLRVTKYRNGDVIGTTSPVQLDISKADVPKYLWAYNGDESYVATYGRLYTWYAVTDSRKICPTGWHIPTDDDWTTLTVFLGGLKITGGKLKEAGTAHWQGPNREATNETGFTALPGSYRGSNGEFNHFGQYGGWWSSSELNPDNAWCRYMTGIAGYIGRYWYGKGTGFSVRCLKD